MRQLIVLWALTACSVPSAIQPDDAATSDAVTIDDDAAAAHDGGTDAPPLPPSLVVTPDTAIDVGDIAIGSSSGAAQLTITNDGGGDSGVVAVALVGPTGGFALSLDGCSGAPLAAGSACTVEVRFQPTTTGEAIAHVRITATPGGTFERVVTGRGHERGVIDVTESAHDYATIAVDGGGREHVFDVSNRGTELIAAPIAGLTGTSDSYAITGGTCDHPMAPGDHCSVTVRFDPTTVGSKPASLVLAAALGGSDSAGLVGTGFAHVLVTKEGTGTGRVLSNVNGIDCGGTCSADFTTSPVQLLATADPGSTFTGWFGDCPGATCALTLIGQRSARAEFTADLQTLHVDTTVGEMAGGVNVENLGLACASTCDFPIAAFQTVSATPVVPPHAIFTGWGGACSGTGQCIFSMTGPKTVTAHFLRPRVLTVRIAGPGAVQSFPSEVLTCVGDVCTASMRLGDRINVWPASSNFTGWSGPSVALCQTPSPTSCMVDMNVDIDVTASFD